MEPLSTTKSSPGFGVYTGVWTNWSYGQILGKTLTLDRRDGDLLIAFVALFVTIVGTSFWRVTCFAIHYYLSSEAPQDGLYHQRQAILRNSANGASGLWHLIRTFWAWRRNGIKPASRVLPMILYAALCLCVFGAASGFSSKVVTSVGNEVLISSASFGALSSSFPANSTNLQEVDWAAKMVVLRIRETTSYIRYAERCYTNGSNLVGCDTFVKSCLASQAVRDAECPLSNICRSNDQNIYLDTGLLDLSDDFGMNVPPSQRFQFRVATHCAPLKTEGYKKYESSGYTEYFYGATREATYQYPDHPSIWDHRDNASYTISVQSTYPQNGTFAGERPGVKHTNFSVFGLVLILTAGGFIILLSWFIEHLFAFIQKRRNLDAYARLEWATNEVLQLQRMAHEQLGMGTWSACDAEVPITGKGEKLAVLDLGALNHPRLVAPPKGFEHEMAEPKRDDLETGGTGHW